MPGHQTIATRRLIILLIIVAATLAFSGCAAINRIRGKGDPVKLSAAYYNRAMTFMQARRYPQAVTDLQRAIMADPNMYQAYYQLGRAYQAQGQAKHARQSWVIGLDKAQHGPERKDYPRAKAIAELRAALAGQDAPATVAKPAATARPRKPAVKTTAVAPPKKSPPARRGSWAVLYSSNLKIASAQADVRRLQARGIKAMVKTHKIKGRIWHRVWVDCCTSYTLARRRARQLNAKGIARGAVVMRPGK